MNKVFIKPKTLALILLLTANNFALPANKEHEKSTKETKSKLQQVLKTISQEEKSKYKRLKRMSTCLAITQIGLEAAPLLYPVLNEENNSNAKEIHEDAENTTNITKALIDSAIETKESIVLETIKRTLTTYKKNKEKKLAKEDLSREILTQGLELAIQRMSHHIISTSVDKRVYRRILRTIANSAILSISKAITENNINREKISTNFLSDLFYYAIIEAAGEMIIRELEAAEKN